MALVKRGGVWYIRKMINGQLYRVHRVRGQEGRRATGQRDRARHPRGRARLEEHDSELR